MQTDIFTIKQAIIEAGEISALAVVRLINPSFDEVKRAEAVKLAGSSRWLDDCEKEGLIKPFRRGKAKNSPKYYSRMEIVAVKKAEAEIAKLAQVK